MFIGHFGVGFAAKKAAPKTSLGTLFLAAQFVDLFWLTFLLIGFEQAEICQSNTSIIPLKFVSYPYSYSLQMVIVWVIRQIKNMGKTCR